MKKIKKSAELLWLFGIVFVAIGVALYDALNPISSFFSVGANEYIFQGILLIFLCLIIRKFNYKYLFAFAVAVIYGYTLNLFLWIFSGIEINAVWLRWVTLIFGDIVTAFGVACFFRTYMPLQVYELFVAQTSKSFKISINKAKWAFDISLLVISIVLALVLFGDIGDFDFSSIFSTSYHSIGLGTIVTTIINSPIIATMGRLIDKFFDPEPLFPKMKAFFSED